MFGRNKREAKTIEFEGNNQVLFTRVRLEGLSKEDRIIVPQTHSAIVLCNGKLTETYSAGEHYIDPNGLHKDAVVEAIYLSKTVRIPCLFGTSSPIVVRDPSTELAVEIGVRGTFDVNIENPRQAYLELIGVVDNFNLDSLKERLRILMNARIGSVVSNVTYDEKISFDMYDFNKEKIEKLVLKKLEEEFRTQYGVKLFSLIVESIFMKDDFKQKILEERERLKNEENAPKAFCTKCGNQINPNDTFCSKCGERIVRNGNACPNCGKVNDPDSAFCAGCGRKLK